MSILQAIKKAVGLKAVKDREREEQAKNAEEVFRLAKESIDDTRSADVKDYIKSSEKLHKKFLESGQYVAAAKVAWLMQVARAEEALADIGITKHIPVRILQDLLDKHPSRALKICNLEDYERAIPDDALAAKKSLEGVFNCFMVLYTDHTKRQRAADVRPTRDPILLGLFKDVIKVGKEPADGEKDTRISTGVISDRLYVIASWEDEYCDLTFDKLIKEATAMGLKGVNATAVTYVPADARLKASKVTTEFAKKNGVKVLDDDSKEVGA